MRSRGFLLLESFVALLILGSGVTVLMSAVVDSTARSVRSGERGERVRRAHDILTVGIASFDWSELRRSGSEGGLHWEIDMMPDVPTPQDLPPGSLVPVTATINLWGSDGGGVRFATMFIARKPAP